MGNTPSAPSGPGAAPDSCPVSKEARAQMMGKTVAQSAPAEKPTESLCPVSQETRDRLTGKGKSDSGPVYNVYSQVIDPSNHMPPANQGISEGQRFPLPTDRVQSSIPKGGTDGTWQYPSQQMFFNALRRKGKGDDVSEEDVESIVAVHNNMNERTWKSVLEWEKLHCSTCSDPKLRRFIGRVNDLTPKARIKSWFGFPIPFDRHDWFVDRCGTEVRYVIDFYHNERQGELDRIPALQSPDAIKSITMDARPALDSFGALYDRLRFPLMRAAGLLANEEAAQAAHNNEPFVPASGPVSAAPAAQTASSLEQIHTKCEKISGYVDRGCFLVDNQRLLIGVSSDYIWGGIGFALHQTFVYHSRVISKMETCRGEECPKFAVALQQCVASVVCPSLAESFLEALQNGSPEAKVAAEFEKMNSCVAKFQDDAKKNLTR